MGGEEQFYLCCLPAWQAETKVCVYTGSQGSQVEKNAIKQVMPLLTEPFIDCLPFPASFPYLPMDISYVGFLYIYFYFIFPPFFYWGKILILT